MKPEKEQKCNGGDVMPAVAQQETRPAIGIGAVSGGLVPTTFEGLFRMSQVMAASKLIPKGIETPEAVFVAVQMGLEVGLSPMQSVQNIAVVNGRPSIWGDSVLGLVRASGLLERFAESIDGVGEKMVARCVAKRKGDPDEVVREFGVDDAKTAGLWKKAGPWSQYPKRMLQMRARSWALRDGFGDVLRGLRTTEEVMDYDVQMQPAQGGGYEPAPQVDTPDKSVEALFMKRLRSAGIEQEDADMYLKAAAEKYGVDASKIVSGAVQSDIAWNEFIADYNDGWWVPPAVGADEDSATTDDQQPETEAEELEAAAGEVEELVEPHTNPLDKELDQLREEWPEIYGRIMKNENPTEMTDAKKKLRIKAISMAVDSENR